MVKQIQMKLSESKTARWSVLALVAFTMLCGYFITDMMAPLQDLLQTPVMSGGLGWSGDDYGKFTSAYGWFNVFLLMLIFGGMILDKMGVRFTGLMATGIMLVGVFIKWFGISHDFGGETVSIFGTEWGYPLLIASLGYALFGVGIEIAGITVSKIIVKWFKGKEMALAMGLEMACARIGTGLAIGITPILSRAFNNSISIPIFIGLILLCIGFLSFIVFVVMDKKRDQEILDEGEEEEEADSALTIDETAKVPVKAVVDGKVIAIEDVKDGIFSEKVLGDGVGIIPTSETVLAPAEGEICTVMEGSKHAIGVQTTNNSVFLIHVGIETVSMNGEGFEYLVKKGQHVKEGQPILKFDKAKIEAKGLNPVVVFVKTDEGNQTPVAFKTGINVKAGKDVIGE